MLHVQSNNFTTEMHIIMVHKFLKEKVIQKIKILIIVHVYEYLRHGMVEESTCIYS